MDKKKKIGIIASAIATCAVCTSMIVGSTYALFTSNDSVNVTVSSGKVAVTTVVENAKITRPVVIGEEETTDITVETDGKAVALSNVIPGDTVSFDIAMSNVGTVNAKYQYGVQATAGYKLFSAFDVAIATDEATVYTGSSLRSYTSAVDTIAAGDSVTYHVTLSLDSNKGDEYQGLTTNIDVSTYAVQYNAAFSGKAKVETLYNVSTKAGVVSAFQKNNAYVLLEDDVDATGTNIGMYKDATVDLNGHTLKLKNLLVRAYVYGDGKGANITIKNGDLHVSDLCLQGDTSVVTFDNVSIYTDGVQAVYAGYGDKAIINSGLYEGHILYSLSGKVNVYVDLENKTLTDAAKNVCTFDAMEYVYMPDEAKVVLKVGELVDGVLPETVVVNDDGYVVGTDGGYGIATPYLLNLLDAWRGISSITVYGGTFVNFNPADNCAEGMHGMSFVAEGYEVVYIQDANSNYLFTVVSADEVAGYVADGYTHYEA